MGKTNPDYIVVSADKGNRYAHPRLSILQSVAAIRPPPTRRDILFENVYGPMRDRFNATTLAREVKSHVEEVIHDLKDPNPFGSFGLPSLPSDTLNLHPSNPGKPAQPTSSKRIGYDQVLITGERGNLEFIDGRFIGSNDPENASFLSIVWNELPDATDAELKRLDSWEDAQAYLSIVAAGRKSLDTAFPMKPLRVSGG